MTRKRSEPSPNFLSPPLTPSTAPTFTVIHIWRTAIQLSAHCIGLQLGLKTLPNSFVWYLNITTIVIIDIIVIQIIIGKYYLGALDIEILIS